MHTIKLISTSPIRVQLDGEEALVEDFSYVQDGVTHTAKIISLEGKQVPIQIPVGFDESRFNT